MSTPEWMMNPPDTLEGKVQLLTQQSHLLKSPGKKGQFLRNLIKELDNQQKAIEERAKQNNPFDHIKVSYEQMLFLNAWMYGIAFICIYACNRMGKTFAEFLNVVMWIFPIDPRDRIFKRYYVGDPIDDPENIDNPNKGKLVEVFPRPDISAIARIHRLLLKRPNQSPQSTVRPPSVMECDQPDPNKPHYESPNREILQWLQKEIPSAFAPAYPDAPWNTGGVIWFGAQDHDKQAKEMWPMFRSVVPSQYMDRYVTSEREMSFKITSPTGRVTRWEMQGKSYESKDTKWASGAVDIVLLTEGFPLAVWREVKARFKDPGIGGHDFTPYEPTNQGASAALAQRIKNGTERLPVPYHVFTDLSIYTIPTFVMSKNKKKGMISAYKDDPEGKARLDGEFYSSSLLILSHLSKSLHLLEITLPQLLQLYPTARLYRGLDPGLDHPTACTWGALLPTNQWVIYRIFSQRGLSISERCEKIVALSNNALSKKYYGAGPEDFYLQETHPNPNSEVILTTITDYHLFKRDELTKASFSTNYIISGLQVSESLHTGPAERAMLFNSQLQPSPFLSHPLTHRPPAPRVFFLREGLGVLSALNMWEELYWDRKRSGEDKGQPKDKVPEHGDDELDSTNYITTSNKRWTTYSPRAILSEDSEPEEHLIQRMQQVRHIHHQSNAVNCNPRLLQSLQKVHIFGGDEPSPSDLDDDIDLS